MQKNLNEKNGKKERNIWLDNKKKTKTNLFNLSVLKENWNPSKHLR